MKKESTILCNSNAIEPAMAHIIGHLYARCEEIVSNPDEFSRFALQDEVLNLWRAINAMRKLAITATGAHHFGMALTKHYKQVDQYIERTLGYSPIMKSPADHKYKYLFDRANE